MLQLSNPITFAQHIPPAPEPLGTTSPDVVPYRPPLSIHCNLVSGVAPVGNRRVEVKHGVRVYSVSLVG